MWQLPPFLSVALLFASCLVGFFAGWWMASWQTQRKTSTRLTNLETLLPPKNEPEAQPILLRQKLEEAPTRHYETEWRSLPKPKRRMAQSICLPETSSRVLEGAK